jgi:glutamate-5-semialdehyde dehydrogenase
MLDLTDIGRRAKAASAELAKIPDAHKVVALQAIAAGLKAQQDAVLTANAADVAAAEANGVRPAMVERLALSPKKLAGMASDVLTVAGLPDPVGERFDERTLPNGMQIARQRVPIGVLGVIYESRPNVTIDIAALAIKTGNTVILRGGSDNLRSNLALLQVVQAALAQAGLPMDAVQLITDTDRRYVSELLKLHQYVDLIIPRGGSALHKLCRENSTIQLLPVEWVFATSLSMKAPIWPAPCR